MPPEPVSRRDRPAKTPLSRRSILDATLALIRERGVDAVALRHVAEAVDTGPASLYAYFDGRDALLEHALDAVYATVELVEADGRGWKPALAETITNTIRALESFPGIGTVALGTIPTLPGALRIADHELALMEAGGIDTDDAALAIDLIAQLAAATAIERALRGETSSGDSGQRDRLRAAYAAADPTLFPRVTRLADRLTAPDDDRRRRFAINVIIDGLQRAHLGT